MDNSYGTISASNYTGWVTGFKNKKGGGVS